MTSEAKHKQHIQQRFGSTSDAYITSNVHAHGQDLDRLINLVEPQPDWIALDIATGAGHTAGKLAQYTQMVVACDLTDAMLRSTKKTYPLDNLKLCESDAENLPFVSGSIDLITCRFAAHHFPQPFRFIQACNRVLMPGGMLAVIDHVNPDDTRAANYLDAFERLRDPSHVQAYAEHEWRGMFLDGNFHIDHVQLFSVPAGGLEVWAERQQRPPDVIEKLHVMLAQMPGTLRDFIHPSHAETPAADFYHQFIMIIGHKPQV